MDYQFTKEFASKADNEDKLAAYRSRFHIPKINGKDGIYFTGNSLGLQPKDTKALVEEELESWKNNGVEGHFHGDRPWFHYHKLTKRTLAALVGAESDEVVLMNGLTTNLHLMMVSFYQPTQTRYKIITEAGAFPSDQYALESQVKFHGYNPVDAIIELMPRSGEDYLRTEDIVEQIHNNRDSLALVLIGGVQYFTGQLFDMATIAIEGQKTGAKVGFDLAHAVGNVPLHLHDWDVDFAVWCTYKYLNAGPGNIAGAFVHARYANDTTLPRFAGWWGHDEDKRFLMQKGFVPMPGADGWQHSNVNIISAAAVLASLNLFSDVDFTLLRNKSIALTGYAQFLIDNIIHQTGASAKIITPKKPEQRGCQLSLAIDQSGKQVFDHLISRGIITDWREPTFKYQPGIIRLAPVPFYNSFEDVYEFALALKNALIKYHG